MTGETCRGCGDLLTDDPHKPGAGPQRWLCRQCRRRDVAGDHIAIESGLT
ncbi:MAG: hypothetical protein OXC00_16070 [Acidimicrobiaceae bacterium]|nr:hypothetical protein [Acidimicrobiaceae bacterium]